MKNHKSLINSKKAMVLYYIVIPGFIAGLIMFYITSLNAAEPETKLTSFIGEKQLAMIHASQQAEKYLLYLDKSANLAASKSYYDLAANGGFAITSPCNSYKGYSLWKTQDKDCYPIYYKDELKARFLSSLNELMHDRNILEKTDTFFLGIPSDIDYDIYMSKDNIIGIADKDILIDTYLSNSLVSEYVETPSFSIKTGYDIDEFRTIIDQAADLVEECSIRSDYELTSCVITESPENWQMGSCEGDIENKDRTYRFCIQSNTIVLTYEKTTKKSDYQPIQYRFALQFPQAEKIVS